MSSHHPRRVTTAPLPGIETVPPAPPLPPQHERYSQQARYALGRVLGFGGRGQYSEGQAQHVPISSPTTLTSSNATAIHRTGLQINALSINDSGTHALVAGKQIFKTIRVDGDSCAEDANIRAAIRTFNASVHDNSSSNSANIASSREAVDVHDVAWAKGTTGNFIAAATYNGPIVLYDLNRLGIEIARLFDHRRQVHRVTFNPHAGHYMLSASQDGTVRMWDIRDCQRSVTTFTSQRATPGQNDGIRDVKWSPTNGTEFALGTDSGWIQKWDTQMMRTAKVKIAAHATACSTIDWHPDGRHILSAGTDRAVRVWNVASEGGRRHKPTYEIRVPHPLRNARWRPSFQSVLHGESGVRQCTQLVTSYDRDYPMLHIWDLRRPHLPFRELECYQTAPTDLLWHSQDLLWTVGREGIFTQSDVSYAQKIVDKRNVQSFAISAQGEVNVVTQTRRPKLNISRPPLEQRFERPKRHATDLAVPQKLARSAGDDTLDDNFLRVFLNLSRKSPKTIHPTRATADTPPPVEMSRRRTLPLDSKMERFRGVRPVQMAARGVLPGGANSLLIVYFAQKYKLRPYLYPPTVESFQNIHEVFEQNAKIAKLASMHRLSQSWRIVGQIISKDLKRRAEANRSRRLKRQMPAPDSIRVRSDLSNMINGLIATHGSRASNPPTPLSAPIQKNNAMQNLHAETASNMPTPRARPSSNRISGFGSGANVEALPDIDSESPVQLPPLVIEPGSDTSISMLGELEMDGNNKLSDREKHDSNLVTQQRRGTSKQRSSLYGNEDQVLQTPPKLVKHDSDDSFTVFPPMSSSRAPSIPDLAGSAQTRLMDIVSENLKTMGRDNASKHSGGDEDPVSTASLESPFTHNGRATFSTHPDTSNSPLNEGHIKETGNKAIAVPERPKSRGEVSKDMQTLARNNQESFTSDTDLNPNSQKELLEPPKPAVPQRQRSDTSPAESGTAVPSRGTSHHRHISMDDRYRSVYDPKHGVFIKPRETLERPATAELLVEDYMSSEISPDGADDPIISISAIMNQLIKYHTTTLSDSQSLTALLLLLLPLLPETSPLPENDSRRTLVHYIEHLSSLEILDPAVAAILNGSTMHLLLAGVNPLQIESVLQTYHDQLLSLSLPVNAALLRRLSYPTFPTVYDTALKENQLSFRCSVCSKPLISNKCPARSKCDSCQARPPQCPICWSPESPYDLQRGQKKRRNRPASANDSALHRNPTLLEPSTESTATHGLFSSRSGAGQNSSSPHHQTPNQHLSGRGSGTEKPAIPPSLFTACLNCNHAAHAACLSVWHGFDSPPGQVTASTTSSPALGAGSSGASGLTPSRLRGPRAESGGFCPVEGCGCACVELDGVGPGSASGSGLGAGTVSRQGSGLGHGSLGRQRQVTVLDDEFKVGESRAVAGVRRRI